MNKKILSIISTLIIIFSIGGMHLAKADTAVGPGAGTTVTAPTTTSGGTAVTDYQFLAPLTSYGQPLPKDFFGYIKGLLQISISLAVMIAVLMIVYGGILYMSTDAIQKKEDGKKIIVRTMWGLAIIIACGVIIYTINPALLNLGASKNVFEEIKKNPPQQPGGSDTNGISGTSNFVTPPSYTKKPTQGSGTGGYSYTPVAYDDKKGGYTDADSTYHAPVITPGSGGSGTTFVTPPGGTGAGYTPGPGTTGDTSGGGVPWTPGSGGGSTGGAGYSDTSLKPGANAIYVSASEGSDSNQGGQNAPLKSIGAAVAKLHDGSSDQILLKKGETYNGSFSIKASGASASAPIVIGSYGTGARPIIVSAAENIINGKSNIVISGIHFKYAGGTAGLAGIHLQNGFNNILIEDVYVEGFQNGISAEANDLNNPGHNVTLRRSIVANNQPNISSAHSQGFYAHNIQGILLEENLFDTNGRFPNNTGGSTMNQNVYITSYSSGLIVRGNIFAHAANYGLQARPGGVVDNNFFYRNPVNMSFGKVDGASHPTDGGVTGGVTNNVIIGSGLINGNGTGGAGIFADNIQNATISNNIIAENIPGNKNAALDLAPGSASPTPYGIHNLTIQNNIVYNWDQSLKITGYSAGPGQNQASNVTITGNDFTNLVYPTSIIQVQGLTTSPNYPNPHVAEQTYDNLIEGAKNNSRDNWNSNYTAATVNASIRQGFGR